MNKEIENLIRKSMAKDIEIELLEKEIKGEEIGVVAIRQILEKLTKTNE